jgi:hypothetical protein
MAIDHTGKNKHKREGRTSPHGAGEPETDRTVTGEHAGEEESGERRAPPAEYKREEASDVPGVKKKIR